ncbi:MAG: tautomerase family protein [Nitrospinota bacterium]|nr:tautomerase family protein [Nitrospinota bacterium]
MPHVVVKLFPGRTDEQKKACAKRITAALIETVNATEGSVSVAFHEVAKKDWENVYNIEITGEEESLYKKPGYKMVEGEIVND